MLPCCLTVPTGGLFAGVKGAYITVHKSISSQIKTNKIKFTPHTHTHTHTKGQVLQVSSLCFRREPDQA